MTLEVLGAAWSEGPQPLVQQALELMGDDDGDLTNHYLLSAAAWHARAQGLLKRAHLTRRAPVLVSMLVPCASIASGVRTGTHLLECMLAWMLLSAVLSGQAPFVPHVQDGVQGQGVRLRMDATLSELPMSASHWATRSR